MEYAEISKTYKRKVAGSYMLVDGNKLMDKINGEEICVTRKLDGAMHILFYKEGQALAVTSNGIMREDLSCIKEFAVLAAKAGCTALTVAAELYAVLDPKGRERVSDVSKAIADPALAGNLRLAVFDILDIDGEPFQANHYKEKISKIIDLFSGNLVHPVEHKNVSSKYEVAQIFNDWVVDNGAEGLVVHTELPIVYKIKRRHSVDAAIIGYTVGEDENSDAVRDILVAVMREDGMFQQFAATGNGFTDEQKRKLCTMLEALSVESDYIETDSRNVAFKMVKPEVIVELSALDFVAESSTGEAKMNILLSYDPDKGYASLGRTPGVSAQSLSFVRLRDDKQANSVDIRISQLSDIAPFSDQKAVKLNNLPQSEILARRVFKKGSGAKLMVHKFLVWKTNKEESNVYPAYVLHHTDFSIGRKEQLKRDLRVSSSKGQIMELLDELIADNIKKGWEEAQ